MDDKTKLKKIRKITGLNGSDFGKKIGVGGSSTVSNYEKEVTPISKTVWIAIEHTFGHLYEIREDNQGNEYVVPKEPQGQKEDNLSVDMISEPSPDYGSKPDYGQTQLLHDMLEGVMQGTNQKARVAIMTNLRDLYDDKDRRSSGRNDEEDLVTKNIKEEYGSKESGGESFKVKKNLL